MNTKGTSKVTHEKSKSKTPEARLLNALWSYHDAIREVNRSINALTQKLTKETLKLTEEILYATPEKRKEDQQSSQRQSGRIR